MLEGWIMIYDHPSFRFLICEFPSITHAILPGIVPILVEIVEAPM